MCVDVQKDLVETDKQVHCCRSSASSSSTCGDAFRKGREEGVQIVVQHDNREEDSSPKKTSSPTCFSLAHSGKHTVPYIAGAVQDATQHKGNDQHMYRSANIT
jgi:hypothetical protein